MIDLPLIGQVDPIVLFVSAGLATLAVLEYFITALLDDMNADLDRREQGRH